MQKGFLFFLCLVLASSVGCQSDSSDPNAKTKDDPLTVQPNVDENQQRAPEA